MKTVLLWLFYVLLIGLPVQVLVLLAKWVDHGVLFKENGIVEWSQIVVLVTAAVVFGAGRRDEYRRELFCCLQILLWMAVARELDGFLDKLVARGFWKVPFALLGMLLLVAVWRFRTRLLAQIPSFVQTRSFAYLFVGFLVAVLYAQIVGQREFWRIILEIEETSRVKRIVEELCEMLGYILILIGAIEATQEARPASPENDIQQDAHIVQQASE